MIFIVYITEGVVSFACHELSMLLDHITKNKYHRIEVWMGERKLAAHW